MKHAKGGCKEGKESKKHEKSEMPHKAVKMVKGGKK